MQFKGILTSMLVLFLPILMFAQESAIDKIAKETCSCMTEKDLTNLTQDQFEQELGMCMLTAASPMMSQLEQEENINMEDPNVFQKIGEKVGAKIAVSCPDLFSKMMEYYGQETQTEVRQLLLEEGTFAGLKSGEFAQIQLTLANGRTADFLWLEAFEGSTSLETNANSLKGKKISVYYLERSFFDPTDKTYKSKKVIQKIEIN